MAVASYISQIELKSPLLNIANTNHVVERKAHAASQVLWTHQTAEACKDDSFFDVDGSFAPASVGFDHKNPLKLQVRYVIGTKLVGSKGFRIQGRFKGRDVIAWGDSVQEPDHDNLSGTVFNAQVTVKLHWMRKNFPWGFAGDIKWEAIAETPERELLEGLQSTRLEIYGLRQNLAPFFFQRVNVNLLRAFVLPAAKASSQDWTRYVVKACFWDFGFQYGRGDYRYSAWDGGSFAISKWLRDIGRDRFINCYDQAAIVQIALSFGPLSHDKILWKFISPFGLLKKSELVGRGITNNPIPDLESEEPNAKYLPLLVDDKNPLRSGFLNHAFIEAGGKVADACAGPHVGTETIEEYIQNVIVPEEDAKEIYAHMDMHAGKKENVENNLKYGVSSLDKVNTVTSVEAMKKDIENRDWKKSLSELYQKAGTGLENTGGSTLNVNLEKIILFLRPLAAKYEDPIVTIGKLGARASWSISTIEEGSPDLKDIDVDLFVLNDFDAASTVFDHRFGSFHKNPSEFFTKPKQAKGHLNLVRTEFVREDVWVHANVFVCIQSEDLSLEKLQATISNPLQSILLQVGPHKAAEWTYELKQPIFPNNDFQIKIRPPKGIYWHVEDQDEKEGEYIILISDDQIPDALSLTLRAPAVAGTRNLMLSVASGESFTSQTKRIPVEIQGSLKEAPLVDKESYIRALPFEKSFVNNQVMRWIFAGYRFDIAAMLPNPSIYEDFHGNNRFNHALQIYSAFGASPRRPRQLVLMFDNKHIELKGPTMRYFAIDYPLAPDTKRFWQGDDQGNTKLEMFPMYEKESDHISEVEIGFDERYQPVQFSIVRNNHVMSAGLENVDHSRVYDAPGSSYSIAGFWGVQDWRGLLRLAPIWAPGLPHITSS